MFTWYWLHTMRANDVRPYGLFGRVCCAAKSLRSLRIYICFGRGEAVQVYAQNRSVVHISVDSALVRGDYHEVILVRSEI